MIKSILNQIKRRQNPVQFFRDLGAVIGENCEIRNSSFGSEPYLITIGNKVRINSGVQLITHDGGVWVLRNMKEEYKTADLVKPICIGDNVHIGSNAIIMPGVSIGSNCIIGCGAVVTKSIPDNSIAVGIPARVIKTIEEYEEKNKALFTYTKEMSEAEKREYFISKYRNINNTFFTKIHSSDGNTDDSAQREPFGEDKYELEITHL